MSVLLLIFPVLASQYSSHDAIRLPYCGSRPAHYLQLPADRKSIAYCFHQQAKHCLYTSSMYIFSPPNRQGLLDFMLESAFAMLLTMPPPSIPPEQVASGSRQVSRQQLATVHPAECPARCSGSRPVSRQSCSPVDPAEYPARAACQWILPSIPQGG